MEIFLPNMENRNTKALRIKALISQKRGHHNFYSNKQFEGSVDNVRPSLSKCNVYDAKKHWEDTLRESFKDGLGISVDEPKMISALKLNEIKDNNRKYRLKITVLERRIVSLENYISELVVSLHCISRVLNYLRK